MSQAFCYVTNMHNDLQFHRMLFQCRIVFVLAGVYCRKEEHWFLPVCRIVYRFNLDRESYVAKYPVSKLNKLVTIPLMQHRGKPTQIW